MLQVWELFTKYDEIFVKKTRMSVLSDFKNEYECFIRYPNTRSEKTNKWRNEWKSYGMAVEMKPLWKYFCLVLFV